MKYKTSTHRLDADGVLLLSEALYVHHGVTGAVQVLGLELARLDDVHLHLLAGIERCVAGEMYQVSCEK